MKGSSEALPKRRRDAGRRALWLATGLAGQLGFTIAIPLVVFALLGRFLDRRLGTSPWLLLAGVGLAITVTSIILVRTFSRLVRDSADSR